MSKFIWVDDEGWVPAGEYYARKPPKPKTPMVISDITPYQSMSDPGRTVIRSRSHEREYMAEHGLVRHEEVEHLPTKTLDPPGGIEQDIKDAYDQLESGYEHDPRESSGFE